MQPTMNQKSWGAKHPWVIALGVAAIATTFSEDGIRYRYMLGSAGPFVAAATLFLIPVLIILCLPPQMSLARRALYTLFGAAFFPSIALAFLSPMAFDGGASNATKIAVFSCFTLPVTIAIAIFKSKQSLRWFLLPLVPLALFILASIA